MYIYFGLIQAIVFYLWLVVLYVSSLSLGGGGELLVRVLLQSKHILQESHFIS